MFQYYLDLLEFSNMPEFLIKYLEVPSLVRLKKVGYFCGMDYASKNIYNFREYISRYDHSLSVALLTYKLTKNKTASIAALFHDIATPCFSHVIDYMNKDYEVQESTEEYTDKILLADKKLLSCLKSDNIEINDIINFKKHTIVDNKRPKLCADRLDGIILTAIGWTKNITLDDIKEIIENLEIYINEDNELEIDVKSLETAKKIVDINKSIDEHCHSKEDVYMMQLLADITSLAIKKNFITYDELFSLNEEQILKIFKEQDNPLFKELINKFETIKLNEIELKVIKELKKRSLNPLVKGVRFLKF